jgi:hypothetical protein
VGSQESPARKRLARTGGARGQGLRGQVVVVGVMTRARRVAASLCASLCHRAIRGYPAFAEKSPGFIAARRGPNE